MRVLVLRPEPAAARTARTLEARGHEAVLLPLSKAEHDVAAVRAALATPHTAIAVTSAEIARLFSTIDHDLTPHLSTCVFAVGQASADAMKAVGFHEVHAAGGDGAALADSIIAHYRAASVPEHPILYLAGNPRAPGFENRLHEAGIPIRAVESYRMAALIHPPAVITTALLEPVPDAVLLYSPESARAFFRLAPLEEKPARFAALRVLCMSPNVASMVPERFAAQAETAAAPDEASLLALL
ncbi:uroporphyrinogen-III synthase [Shinella sedimenti]|uniref:Uroporphyrinogen-III synthase n=1 Tax=Shinella sedimenti TaxID=2919913 RepID=A0ABT0CMG2_9HYPH|nr:uroporphyrinogen-III synthase [Shinella sedimenti]MCJ8149801.1 uroporphyrinogen-III synthase [Shinella sedimenti]